MNHIYELYKRNHLFSSLGFDINFLWEDKGDLMTDVWRYTELETWGSGALVQAQIFRILNPDTDSGTSAEYGLSVLGREAEHRLFACKRTSQYFVSRPVLHPEISNEQDFSLR